MKINLNAGHTLTSGAVGIIKESTETRNIAREVKRMLEALGHTVYDCTVDSGNPTNALVEVVKMCNRNTVDLNVSIHLNACVKDLEGDGKTTGVEVFAYSKESVSFLHAQKVASTIAEIGFRNRGAKVQPKYYFLNQTTAPAILVECCFVDDKDDVELYNATSMAKAIVKGLVGVEFKEKEAVEEVVEEITKEELKATESVKPLYRTQVGAYGVKANAVAMQKKLKAAGFDAIITQA